MLVFRGVENNRRQFEDTDTSQTLWMDVTPDDGKVDVQDDEATMTTSG